LRLGIDFGTTNSAVAVRRGNRAELVPLSADEFTQRTVIHCPIEGGPLFGNEAFKSYIDQDLTGRFLRSLKSFLSQDVPPTTIDGKRYEFVDLIARYITFLIERSVAVLGEKPDEIVMGRPVNFASNQVDSDKAERTLAEALRRAGVTNYRFQLEPVAAAHKYESTASNEHLVLVGDFGGGTSDFAILRVGPERRQLNDRTPDILAVDGVAKAGDHIDGHFMDCFLLEAFGKNAPFRKRYTNEIDLWKSPVHQQIKRLFKLHRMRAEPLDRGLKFMQTRLVNPVFAERLHRLIFDDLGYPLAWQIEESKKALSASPSTTFQFHEFYSDRLNFETTVGLTEFADSCAATVHEYDAAVSRTLAMAGVQESDIDSVFLTGGTSQLPFLRASFAVRFGEEKISSSDALTSVCIGLALS
jgi:hypothetical chaperone protein